MKRFAKLSQAKEAYEIDAAWLLEPWCNWGTLADNGLVTPYEFPPSFVPGYQEVVQIDPDKAGLFERIRKLEELLARAPTKLEPAKWEPEGGEWFVNVDGDIDKGPSHKEFLCFGVERKTEEQAEKARDKMRVFNRLLAYHDEFCPEYEFVYGIDNWQVFYDHDARSYFRFVTESCQGISVVYFSNEVSKELCKKLNSGEVVL